MPDETVPSHVAYRTLAALRRRGIDAKSVLRRADIPMGVIDNPRGRITVEQMTRFARALWELTDDELWGLGPPMPRGSAYLVMMTAVHAPDLRGVFKRLEHASRVLPGWPDLRVETGERMTRVEVDASRLDDPEHLGTDLLVAVLHRAPGWLIGRRIPLHSVELPYPEPPYATDYVRTFGRLPRFGAASAAITFDNALLTAPVVRDEGDLARYMKAAPADFYSTRDYGSSSSDRVRKILEQSLRGEWPTSEQIAARLAMNADHLRRLLRDEGTSITAIKEELMRDTAIVSLTHSQEPVEELAARLGFSEASAFRRAFRRWTGSPPGTYRKSAKD